MNGATDRGGAEQTPTTHSTPTGPGPMDLAAAVWQLRIIVCVLGAAVLAVSLLFNAFVWKQNRDIRSRTKTAAQLRELQARQQQLVLTINDLAQYSVGNPELVAVFKRYGIDVQAPTGSTATSTPAAGPKP